MTTDKIMHDTVLSATETAIAMYVAWVGPVPADAVAERFGLSLDTVALSLEQLVADGYLVEKKGGKYSLPAVKKAMLQEEEAIFADAIKGYDGVKTTLALAIKRLQRHRDWKDALPAIVAAIPEQKRWRQACRAAGQFVAPWPNLTTWINQRRWEDVLPWPEGANESTSQAYVAYSDKAKAGGYKILLKPSAFDIWVSRSGQFAGVALRYTARELRDIFWNAHAGAKAPDEIWDKLIRSTK